MLRVIEIEHVDFVMSDYIRVSSDGESYLKTLSIPAGRYDKAAMKKEIFPQLIMGENVDYGPLLSVWHCLYRTSFYGIMVSILMKKSAGQRIISSAQLWAIVRTASII